MRFHKLTHAEYRDDREDEARTPVTVVASHHIPSISCEECGTWTSCVRLRVPMPSRADDFLGVRFLSVSEWNRCRDKWARLLNVSAEELAPGAELGPPSATCTSRICEDAVHPFPGQIWVASRVKDAVIGAGLTGVSFVRVELRAGCGEAEMWEMVVHGRSWRRGSTADSLRLCNICGREGFPSPEYLLVDEQRWDGSDVLNLDHNPNIIIVTERAAKVLRGFSNLFVAPIADVVAGFLP